MVEFISYERDEFKPVCCGLLILKIDNIGTVKLRNCLVKSWSCEMNYKGYMCQCGCDKWSVNVPSKLQKFTNDIEDVVNEHIETCFHSCCGCT